MSGRGHYEQRQNEFAELQKKAYQFLIDQSLPASSTPLELVFQLLIQPSFRNHISWTVFSDRAGPTRVARQVIWDTAFDAVRFTNPMEGLKHGWHTWPTTTTQVILLNLEMFDSLMDEGYRSAGEEPQSGIILDGVRWSIYMPGHFEDRTISWNSAVRGNDELVNWTDKMTNFLEDAFNTSVV